MNRDDPKKTTHTYATASRSAHDAHSNSDLERQAHPHPNVHTHSHTHAQAGHDADSTQPTDLRKRKFLARLTTFLGGLGLLAAAFPFLAAWRPSERARALGGPVKVDISGLQPGEKMTVEWRGKPIWIIRRNQQMLQTLDSDENQLRDPNSDYSLQPAFAKNRVRALNKEFLVLIGVCTHLGCSPTFRPQPGELGAKWLGGFFCPCHGSSFDLAGRVFKGVPAPTNLQVPPYRFANANLLIIGEESLA